MEKSEWELLAEDLIAAGLPEEFVRKVLLEEDNLKGEKAPPDFKEKVMQACREFDSLAVGDKVEIRITGMTGLFTAEVIGFDGERWPRLKVLGDPSWARFTLKRDDFIFKRKLSQ
ncbi:MAG: hypothetical protein WAP51_01700 [Candidatus Sungiibacteriota bacterium]